MPMLIRNLGMLLIVAVCVVPVRADDEAKPKPKPAAKTSITISQETTHVTGPIRADGTVDFVEALNQQLKEGVTPETNAAVLLWRAFGPAEVPEELRGEFFERLGIDSLPEKGDYYISLAEVAKQSAKESDSNLEMRKLFDNQSEASRRPWSKAEFPQIAAWIAANEKPSSLMVDASQKAKYYSPLLAEGEPEAATVISVILPMTQQSREVARLLTARAMLAVQEGRFEDARRDLLATHRLGRHIGSGATLIEALVGIAISTMACNGDMAIVSSGKFTSEQLAGYRQELTKLPPLPQVADKIDRGERFLFLSTVQVMATQGPDALGDVPGLGALRNAAVKLWMDNAVNWDAVLKRGNRLYDEMVAALRLPTYRERLTAMHKFDEKLDEFHKRANELQSPLNQIAILLTGNLAQQVTQSMGDMLLSLLLPAVRQSHVAETRMQATFRATQIGLALGAYQRQHGEYPKELTVLTPDFLPELPKDPFNEESFRYQVRDKGFLLYSLGANLEDDGGVMAPPGKDDVAIQVPVEPEA